MSNILLKVGIVLSIVGLYFTITIQDDIHVKEVDTLWESRAKLITLQEAENYYKRKNRVYTDNFETLLEKSASSLRDSELLDALKTILLVKKNTLKVIITTRVPPRDLVEIEPGEHHILHLDKGLEYPYAENVLRKLDRNGRAGFKNASEDLFRKDSRSNVRFSTSSRILLLRCLC